MPFYEYICDTCGHEFERMQKMSDDPVKDCEECGAGVRKKIFAPPVILKGSGFYETEYGRSKHNHPDAKKSEGAKASGSKSGSEAKKSEGSKKDSGGTGGGEKKPKKAAAKSDS